VMCAEPLLAKLRNSIQGAALLEFAYEFLTVAKLLEREERKLMGRAMAPIRGECASR